MSLASGWFDALADRASETPPELFLLLVIAILIAFRASKFGTRLRGVVGFSHIWSFPPLWVSVVAGLLSWIGIQCVVEGFKVVRLDVSSLAFGWEQSPAWMIWAAVISSAAVIGWEVIRRRRQKRENAASVKRIEAAPPTELGMRFEEILAWAKSDEEIVHEKHDCFGHSAVAARIADRLAANGESPTIAIVGAYGSGKSSIRGLVTSRLKDHAQVRVVTVSLWPFTTPEAAAGGLLQALVLELGNHVNTLSIRGLPKEYVGVIDKSGGHLAGLGSLLTSPAEPHEVVARLSGVCTAAGIKLVLWVEDIERFAGWQMTEEQSVAAHDERLGPVRSLLHTLDRCEGISVVVACASLAASRFDMDKIARFVEQPPALEAHAVWDLISRVRQRCLESWPRPHCDPVPRPVRASLKVDTPDSRIARWLACFRHADPSVPEAIAETVQTPRALKSVVRLVLESWQVSCGEVDFDAILVASVIRVCNPDLFAAISDGIYPLREGLFDPGRSSDTTPHPHMVVNQIDHALSRSARSNIAQRTLIKFLFPRFGEGADSAGIAEYVDRPQWLSVNRHVDNWRRFLSQAAGDEPSRDQSCLQSIAAWRDGNPSDLVDRIVGDDTHIQVETFVGQFSGTELCRLLKEVFAHVNQLRGLTWDRGSEAPGIPPIWRMLQVKPAAAGELAGVMESLVDRYTSSDLRLVTEMLSFFLSRASNAPTLVSQEEGIPIRERFEIVFCEAFSGDWAVEETLQKHPKWHLYWAVQEFPAFSPNRVISDASLENWRPVARSLLRAAESHSAVVVPALVPFIVDYRMGRKPGENSQRADRVNIEYSQEKAERLFEYGHLMRVLSEYVPTDDLDEQLKESCAVAVEAAKQSEPVRNLARERAKRRGFGTPRES